MENYSYTSEQSVSQLNETNTNTSSSSASSSVSTSPIQQQQPQQHQQVENSYPNYLYQNQLGYYSYFPQQFYHQPNPDYSQYPNYAPFQMPALAPVYEPAKQQESNQFEQTSFSSFFSNPIQVNPYNNTMIKVKPEASSSPNSVSAAKSPAQTFHQETALNQVTPPPARYYNYYPTPPSDKSIENQSTSTNATQLSDSQEDRSESPVSSQQAEDIDSAITEIFSNKASKDVKQTGRQVKRRNRTQFSKEQLDILEATFLASHYPEVCVVDKLADKLNLKIEKISIWFQNRRARHKKCKKQTPANSSESANKSNVTSRASYSAYNEQQVHHSNYYNSSNYQANSISLM